MVYCVYYLESPRLGDSNENIQYTFMLKKNILLARLYNTPSMARTTPDSNKFHRSKGVRAIEVRLYLLMSTHIMRLGLCTICRNFQKRHFLTTGYLLLILKLNKFMFAKIITHKGALRHIFANKINKQYCRTI